VKQALDQALIDKDNPPLAPAHLVAIDPPFGLQLHKSSGKDGGGVAPCDKAWDKEAWSAGDTIVEALANGEKAGFIHHDHTVVIYLLPELVGEYCAALKKAGYTNVQTMVCHKAEGSR
jgi:hypothetical protein